MRLRAYPEIGRRITISQGGERRARMAGSSAPPIPRSPRSVELEHGAFRRQSTIIASHRASGDARPSDGLWRRDPGERRTPLRLLDRHVASLVERRASFDALRLLAMTIPPEHDVR